MDGGGETESLTLHSGSLFTSEYRFSTDGAGTRVELVVTTTAQTLGAKLRTPVSMLMLGAMKTAMEKEMRHLGKLAEGA